jgi:glycosyltransferase involved in cell wall biosynthesis
MHVCYITAEYPPQIGGVGDYVEHLSREVVSRGYDVTVLTSAGRGIDAGGDGNGAPRVLPIVKRWDLLHLPALIKVLKRVNADVYILEFVVFMYGRGGVAPWMLAFFPAFEKGVGRTLVLNVHETFRPRRPGLKGTVLSYISYRIFKAAVRGSTRAVVTNRYRQQVLHRSLAVDPARVSRIPVGANVLPAGAKRRAARNGDDVRVTSFGLWNGDRALEDVVRAVGAVAAQRPVRLSLVGGYGNENGRVAEVRRLSEESGLNGRLEITGALPSAAVSDYLSRSDIFVSPEAAGPSGRRGSLLAALAHGLPVVAYDGRESEAVFRDGDNIILVPEGDAEALAAALKRLAASRKLRRELGKRARETFEEHFAWPQIAERWDREVFARVSEAS